MKAWISAFRLRTLPLAAASIFLGCCLAYKDKNFSAEIAVFAMLTALFLQILSNLANDYGDSVNGADNVERQGPKRAVQAGKISPKAMKNAVVFFVLLSLISGLMLLWVSFSAHLGYFLLFLSLGILAIVGAIFYTMGSRPYGYAGFGDISVLGFFGWLGTLGTYFLHTKSLDFWYVLPATGIGLMSVAVLNVNNIRDIESDLLAGKLSIPARIGRANGILYHGFLLLTAYILTIIFTLQHSNTLFNWLFLLSFPLALHNFIGVKKAKTAMQTDPFLKKMALTALIYAILLGVGILI